MRYKNTIRRYESEPVVRELRVLVLLDGKSEKVSVPERKKEYAKAQVETITEETETDSKKAPEKKPRQMNESTTNESGEESR